jgi:hypothetical protein
MTGYPPVRWFWHGQAIRPKPFVPDGRGGSGQVADAEPYFGSSPATLPSVLGRSGGMADALDSKSSNRKIVWVQVPPPVLFTRVCCGEQVKRQTRSADGSENPTWDPLPTLQWELAVCPDSHATACDLPGAVAFIFVLGPECMLRPRCPAQRLAAPAYDHPEQYPTVPARPPRNPLGGQPVRPPSNATLPISSRSAALLANVVA